MEYQNIIFEKSEPISLICAISNLSTLEGYTSTMSIKRYEIDDDIIEVEGTINGLEISFDIDSVSNSLSIGKYYYRVILTETATQNTYIVAEGLLIIE